MKEKDKIILSLLGLSAFILSGCSVFSGQYQTPHTYRADDGEGQTDFTSGAKVIEGKIQDVAKGLAPVGGGSATSTTPASEPEQPESKLPMPVVINIQNNYTATLHTEKGDIVIELTAAKTPLTVNNFVYLSQKNFYNGTIFHRVINGFMIQGGDPRGDGTGNPGYTFPDEPFDGEYTRGTVAMANSGPDTNGCQFFIMHKDYPLQKNYVIFGHVVKGLDVVDKIASAEVTANSAGEKSKPVEPVKITGVDITEN